MNNSSPADLDLCQAVKNNNATAAQLALRNGANANCVYAEVNWYGMLVRKTTPLFQACFCGDDDMVRLLLDAGANAKWKHRSGNTIIKQICLKPSRFSTLAILIHHDKSLLELTDAVKCGSVDVVRIVLDQGGTGSIDATTPNGRTALMIASERDEFSKVQLLLTYGANVHATDQDGKTALMIACEKGSTSVVPLLLLDHDTSAHATQSNDCNYSLQ